MQKLIDKSLDWQCDICGSLVYDWEDVEDWDRVRQQVSLRWALEIQNENDTVFLGTAEYDRVLHYIKHEIF